MNLNILVIVLIVIVIYLITQNMQKKEDFSWWDDYLKGYAKTRRSWLW